MSRLFINFGIGNGKTLIATILGILLANKYKEPVVILSKYDHLVLRDQKKYSKLISSFGLATNINNITQKEGVYFYSEKNIVKLADSCKISCPWSSLIMIVDEYDWILLEGSVSSMEKQLRKFAELK